MPFANTLLTHILTSGGAVDCGGSLHPVDLLDGDKMVCVEANFALLLQSDRLLEYKLEQIVREHNRATENGLVNAFSLKW